MIIDGTYFIGAINIAGLGQRDRQRAMDVFIEQSEPDYLRGVLGVPLYNAFKTGVEADEPQQRWEKLTTGDTYVDANGVTQQWTGFINPEKKSPIAYYVFVQYNNGNATTNTVSGEKTNGITGMANQSAHQKNLKAWFEMVELNCKLVDYLRNKKVDGVPVYPEYDGCGNPDLFKTLPFF